MADQPDVLAVLYAAMQRLPDPFNIAPVILEQYERKFGAYPNVTQPRGFNEKIQARKLFDRRPILQVMADKVAARDYVAERLGRAVLPPWLYLTDDPASLPFARLPPRYVLKATHGSGWVEYIQVDLTRFTGHRKNFYDRAWTPVALRQEADNAPFQVPKPANLAVLIEVAETLAQDIDFVRVDLYSVDGKVFFGELTGTPGNGMFRFEPPEFDLRFGDLWRMEIDTLSGLLAGRG
jgi:hypothetical protein